MSSDGPPTPETESPRSWRGPLTTLGARLTKVKRLIVVVAGVGAVIGGLVGYWNAYHALRTASNEDSAAPLLSGFAPPFANSIAVLPFAASGPLPESKQYGQAIAIELTSLLSKARNLHVVASTSVFAYNQTSSTVAQIGRTLRVQYLLTGSVELRGRRLLIIASLENVGTEQRLWTEKYDVPTDGVFDVQDRLAASIAASLAGTSSTNVSSSNPSRTASTEAHIQYLMGRQSFDKGNLDGYRGAIAAYTKAIASDPQYSTAHAGLAMAEFMLGEWTGKIENRSRAAAAADTAIRFSPGEAAGYSARGFIRLRFSWDWAGAESDLKKAIAISPGDSTALREYALLLLALGRLAEATTLMQKAVDLNPLSSDDWSYLWRALSASGQNSAARAAAERAIELQADSTRALIALGTSRLLDGRAREALEVFSRADDPGWRLTGLAMAAHSIGDTTMFTEHLNAAIAQSSADSAYQIAEVYAWRGDSQKGFEWLERAYRQRDGGLITVKYDPLLSSLRGTPRYSALLLQLGLPH